MQQLSQSDMNHLRRLVAWIRCEYFCSPEEIVSIVRENAAIVGEPDEEGKKRLLEWHARAERVPKYVRAAIKALDKRVHENNGEVHDAVQMPIPGKTYHFTTRASACNGTIAAGALQAPAAPVGAEPATE